MPTRDKIFVSYSHKDWRLFEEFKTMLAPAIQQGLVDIWDDENIPAGAQWKQEIETALASARIAVLLVSGNFLASRFIVKHELAPLLSAARNEGVTVFWIYLSSCLYEHTEIASYQAAHDVSKPLDRLTKPQRQAVLSEVCYDLIKTASSPAQPVVVPAGQPDRRAECLLLLTEALESAWHAAGGAAPTTALHRRLELAQKWFKQGTELLPGCRKVGLSPALSSAVDELLKPVLPVLMAEAKWGLPPAGDIDKAPETSDYFREARDAAGDLLSRINELLDGIPEYTAVRDSDRKWSILGFRNERDFDDYLYPPVARLLESPDPMQRDLFERFLDLGEFTPRQLAEQGYRKDLLMDTINALVKEKWAAWTDLTSSGADGKGRLTEVGKRLLKRALDHSAAKSTAGG